ncbi:acyl carrier protein [Chitinimonas lacunae]|uniref:Acyl carrier protein n=1 Tax=Chitinimonas lacunae TaxID=1963018 RepID=A0ABV8MQ16_9NEIS
MERFYEGLAEIFEIDTAQVTPELVLAEVGWDSLAIVSTIALVDELFDVMLNGKALAQCSTVADIQALIEAKR